jgi:hypothetical protein
MKLNDNEKKLIKLKKKIDENKDVNITDIVIL